MLGLPRRGFRAPGVGPPPPPSTAGAEGWTAVAPDRTSYPRRRLLQGSLGLATFGLVSGCRLAARPGPEAKRVARVGWLNSATPQVVAPNLEAFREGMRAHGYEEGRDHVLEIRYAEGRDDRLPDLAA